MVLKPGPTLAAIRAAQARLPQGSPRICLSAQGERFTQAVARELAGLPGMVLVAGRYEGLDERIIELGVDRELSIGDYVLSGLPGHSLHLGDRRLQLMAVGDLPPVQFGRFGCKVPQDGLAGLLPGDLVVVGAMARGRVCAAAVRVPAAGVDLARLPTCRPQLGH